LCAALCFFALLLLPFQFFLALLECDCHSLSSTPLARSNSSYSST
jgi:hypothetical protein